MVARMIFEFRIYRILHANFTYFLSKFTSLFQSVYVFVNFLILLSTLINKIVFAPTLQDGYKMVTYCMNDIVEAINIDTLLFSIPFDGGRVPGSLRAVDISCDTRSGIKLSHMSTDKSLLSEIQKPKT
jgi:hypothetical protein